jgi:predicted MPP superfamily phosphohydrolase
MHLITIGDLHGSPAWKKINPDLWDRMIFIGDYVDSGEFDRVEIISNLHEIIELKKSFPEKVVLLWGNHDLAYFYGGHERHYCSGFKQSMLPKLFSVYTRNRMLFLASFQVSNYLWTHAGVIQQWYDNYIQTTRSSAIQKPVAELWWRITTEIIPPLLTWIVCTRERNSSIWKFENELIWK